MRTNSSTLREVLISGPLGVLAPAIVSELCLRGELVQGEENDPIFIKGQSSDGYLYIVIDGELTVNFTRADGSQDTKSKPPGQLCGESGLVTKHHVRTAEVKVSSPTALLLRWKGNDLLQETFFEPLRRLLEDIATTDDGETYHRTTT